MGLALPIGDGDPLAPLRKTIDTLWSTIAPSGKPKSLRRILFTARARTRARRRSRSAPRWDSPGTCTRA